MLRIETSKSVLSVSAEKVYLFLSDLNNYQKLMPDQVTNWQSSTDECSFTIKNMATVGMKIADKKPFSEIRLISHGKTPLTFNLAVMIENIPEKSSGVFIIFESELNPMFKMMLEKPLENFFNYLVRKLKEIFQPEGANPTP